MLVPQPPIPSPPGNSFASLLGGLLNQQLASAGLFAQMNAITQQLTAQQGSFYVTFYGAGGAGGSVTITGNVPTVPLHEEDADSQTDTPHTPDLATPIIGWRLWNVDDEGIRSYSCSAIMWPKKQPMKAICLNQSPSQHIPSRSCSCGIYAMRTPETLIPSGAILAQVALWGRVLKHKDGYRAQYAYPVRFYLQDRRSWLERLLRKPINGMKGLQGYGVPIMVVKKLDVITISGEDGHAKV